MDKLNNIKCFLLDLDGTIYLGNKLIDGAVDFLKRLKQKNLNYCFVTNNSSRSSKDYIKKLSAIGISATFQEVLTSGYTAINYIKKNHKGKSVYLLGTQSFYNECYESGIKLTEDNPDIVLISYDIELTYKKLCKACKYISNGAVYYATHPDINCPSEEGSLPDVGSFISLIEKSTGKLPQTIFGKPYATMAETVMQRFALDKSEIAMVGDRLSTDIMFALNSGFVSVLVLSGETDKKMLKTSGITPTIVADSVRDLFNK